MKLIQFTAIALALGLTASGMLAQDGPGGQQPPPDQGNEGPGGPPPDGGPDGPPPDGGQGGKHHRPPPFMQALDTNHDGILSADEIANAAKSLLTLDKNGDGQITLEEFLGPRPLRGPGGPGGNQTGSPDGNPPPDGPPGGQSKGPGGQHPPIPPIFAALDTNGDGVLSADEIANAPKSLLKLDKNADGQLTQDELRPGRRPPPRDSNN